MSPAEIRAMVLEGLAAAGITSLRNSGLTQSFLDGECDIAFSEIEMDSLATMELCIAIEANTGVTILPEDLQHIDSLGGLVSRIGAAVA